MRFKKIIIDNFGPFKEPTTIDFSEKNGVTIIWGRNGRGKTTILNAFNFVINSTVKDRDKRENNYISFINESGAKEGNYTFKVTLDLEENEKKYRIIRSVSPVATVDIPQSNNDLTIDLQVKEGTSIMSAAAAEHFVKGIMNNETSRFFLFDGELLMEYEELLNEKSENGNSIKNSIEQILGMPILTYGEIDAESAREKVQTAATKVAQNDDKTKRHSKAIEMQEEDKKTQEAELDRLEKARKQKEDEKNQLQNIVNDTDKIREYALNVNNIEEKIKMYERVADEEKAAITVILKEAWKWIISPTISIEIDAINEGIEELQKKELTSKEQNRIIDYLTEAINETICPVCEYPIEDERKRKLEEKIKEIKTSSAGLTCEEEAYLENEKNRLMKLKQFLGEPERNTEIAERNNKVNDFRVKASDLREHNLKELKNDLEALKKNVAGTSEADAIINYEKLQTVMKEIGVLEEGIKEQKDKIDKIVNTIKDLNEKIFELSKDKDVVLAKEKVKRAENIKNIFSEGIDLYREKLRKEVEKDATEIFLAMNTEEEDYGGLRINDNYGLTIIRKSDGEPVPKRSAGWEHMVAFALIGALHKNAPFNGPVIMDSPFYRLDKFNTASMVKAIPLIANQVLLLPYPGEIDENITRTDLAGKLVQELKIERISSNESEIKEMK